ncbi:MAG: hypothetical protein N2Z80_01115 [Hydrogenothermaceae bacterium]|nr:hypothetical protein [Hydrogenothermaceae bacterium]
MAKIVKFNVENKADLDEVKGQSTESSKVLKILEVKEDKLVGEDEEVLVKKAVEDHILSNFAVRNILGMDIIYKLSKTDLGVIGKVAYEHKRREGLFIADFIAKGGKRKEGFFIDTLAFEAGEPELYRDIVKILKAKKALPRL